MREHGDIAVDRARAVDHPIHTSLYLRWRLTARTSVPEDEPAGLPSVNLLGCQAFVIAVVPLHQVGVDDRSMAETSQPAGVQRSLHRTHENEFKGFLRQHRSYLFRAPSAMFGKSDVRGACMLAAEAIQSRRA